MEHEITGAARLFLATPFEEYTVSEGLLLFLLLGAFLWLLVSFFRGGGL